MTVSRLSASAHTAYQAVELSNLLILSDCLGDTNPVGHDEFDNCQHALQTSPFFLSIYQVISQIVQCPNRKATC
jgi:hypothetical protein